MEFLLVNIICWISGYLCCHIFIKRGPMGPPGMMGLSGPKGDRGDCSKECVNFYPKKNT